MTVALWSLALLPLGLFSYAYVLYPLAAGLLAGRKREGAPRRRDPEAWPSVTLMIPAYNEADTIADKLENTLALDYPEDRLQILVVSDASTDRTDDIVRAYRGRGIQLARLDRRGGKEAAQNHAHEFMEGRIVVNSDASSRLEPGSLKALVRPFSDPTVGAVSGRAVGIGEVDGRVAEGETLYFRYEMAVRRFESGLGSIVGAVGALYAVRRELFSHDFPGGLNRDFGTVLIARERGYRSVLAEDAICRVSGGHTLRKEFARKMRTMSRGLHTLARFRRLLNPFRFGSFSLVLASHKLARWSVYLTVPAAVAALAVLAPGSLAARLVLAALGLLGILGTTAVCWPSGTRSVPSALRLVGYAVVSISAGIGAWGRFLRGSRLAVWEPTRRTGAGSAAR